MQTTNKNACVFLCFEIQQKCKHIETERKDAGANETARSALTAIHIYLIYCLKKEPIQTRSEKEKRIAFILTYALIFRWKKQKKKKNGGDEKTAGWLPRFIYLHFSVLNLSLSLPPFLTLSS